ncbi:NlpC/P60 family protein [Alicyclobacillus sp. ALC3]|uniref:NlpC/P60 family protein n=1 Tax=Alicyclobacillus sp. ALC3 TaxID=2796143 RepID=UPI002379FB7E|nr:NlpC/P60 family protein [Alicyclobacillus sp. ALC3]WDL97600.1 SH3 domain-containing protein [Alicyclobacillus sp. ALC3]
MKQLLPGVTADMLRAEFWSSQITDNFVYDSSVCQSAWVRSSHLYELSPDATYDIAPAARPSTTLYDRGGGLIDDEQWRAIEHNSQVWRVPPVPGFTVLATALRRWATPVEGFRIPDTAEFDRLLDTTLHTFEPVVIVGASQDRNWYYVYSRTYHGFVCARKIATTDWSTFAQYKPSQGFTVAVVTAPHTITAPQPYDAAVMARTVEFAAVLPTTDSHSLGNQLNLGHAPVLLPVRRADGTLELHPAYLPATDVHVGCLGLSRANCLSLGFSLLYQRYGWGGRLGVHDCSSFVMDIYRAMGVQLPRDTRAQEASLPSPVSFIELTEAERIECLTRMQPGDVLYMPGHVMMYLGMFEGRPYVLHDFQSYVDGGIEVHVNQVMVSTLDIQTSQGKTYLSALTTGGAFMVR